MTKRHFVPATARRPEPGTPAGDGDVAAWVQRGGLLAGLWLRDLGAVDDPQPGAIGLLAQDLRANAGVVGRAG